MILATRHLQKLAFHMHSIGYLCAIRLSGPKVTVGSPRTQTFLQALRLSSLKCLVHVPHWQRGQQVLAAENWHIHIMSRQRQGVPAASQVAGQQPLPPRHAKRWHHIPETPWIFHHCTVQLLKPCLYMQWPMVALAFRTTNFSAVRHDVHVSAPIETPGQRIDRFSLVLLATRPAAENLSPKPKCTLQHLHPSLGRHISRTKTSATLPCYQVSVAL